MLVFRYSYDNVDQIQAGLDAFEKQNPGIKVTLERIAFKDARDQFLREAATGGGPDVVHLAFVWIKDLGTAGACMKLNDLIDKPGIGEKGWSDFIASDLTYGSDGKSIYGVPFATDTWAMVYNTDLMKAAGIDKTPQTWDELLADSRAVKSKTGKIGFGFAAGSSAANTIWFLANFYWWSDGARSSSITARAATSSASRPRRSPRSSTTTRPTRRGSDHAGQPRHRRLNAPEVTEPMIRGDQLAASMPVFTAPPDVQGLAGAQPGQGAAVHDRR